MNANEIERARIRAAEDAVVAGLPPDLLAWMTLTQAKFKADGGCKGCGSMVQAVHNSGCPTLTNECY